MEKIIVEVKFHYGSEHIYVLSNHKEAICRLTGKRTISRGDVEALKELGFEFEVKNKVEV